MTDRLNFDKEIHNFISEMRWQFDKDLLDGFCDSVKSEYNIK